MKFVVLCLSLVTFLSPTISKACSVSILLKPSEPLYTGEKVCFDGNLKKEILLKAFPSPRSVFVVAERENEGECAKVEFNFDQRNLKVLIEQSAPAGCYTVMFQPQH